MRRLRALSGATLLLAALACGEAREPGFLGVRLRFIEAEPELVLEGDRSAQLREVFFHRLPAAGAEADARSVEVPLVFAAEAVDRIAVILEEPAGGVSPPLRLNLRWASAGEALSDTRRVLSGRARAWGSGRRRYVFDTRSLPEWVGDITLIAIDTVAPRSDPPRLVSVVGLAREGETGQRFANRVQSRVLLDWRYGRVASPEGAWVAKTLDRDGEEVADKREIVFTKRVDLRAHYFSGFEVRLRGLGPSGRWRPLHLLWRGPDQEFSVARRLTSGPSGDPSGDGRVRYRFLTRGRDGWRGRIEELRLVFGLEPTEAVEIGRFTGFADRPSRQHLDRALEEGFQVTLEDEMRAALPAVPGQPIERRLEIEAGSVLRLAFGAPEGAVLPLDFEILAASGEAEPRTLFGQRLADAGETDRWHEAEVDLASLAGGSRRLILRTSGELRPGTAAIPAWAHPEVLSPVDTERPPSVLLVVVDTLRADRLSLYGHHRPTSPLLDAWAGDRATVFASTVAPAPWTLPSHLSLFSAIDAMRFGRPTAAPTGVPLLAELLRRSGYTTAAVTGGGFLHPDFGFARGFERFRYYSGRRIGAGGEDADEDRELELGVEHALEVLERNRDRPFLLFFHTYETHMPFLPREPFFSSFSRLTPTSIRRLVADEQTADEGFVKRKSLPAEMPHDADPQELLGDLYDSGVAYADLHLGRLLAGLEEKGLDRDTVVVVTSDHGELLGEHGLTAHTSLYDENLMVPLVIADPRGRGAGTVVERQVRLVDVMPTILDLAGLPAPAGVDGASLVPLMEGGVGEVPETAWSYAPSSNYGLSVRQANRWKYTFNNTAWPAVHGAEELVRVGGEGAAVEDPATMERLRDLAKQRLEHEAPGLRVRLENLSAAGLRVTLSGPMISTNSVKSSELDCPCPIWEAAGRAAIDLPPGSATSLRLEVNRLAPLGLVLESSDGETARYESMLDPDLLGADPVFVATGGRWQRRPDSAAVGSSGGSTSKVELRWLAGALATAGADPELDEALANRLEALGYIE